MSLDLERERRGKILNMSIQFHTYMRHLPINNSINAIELP